MIDPKEIEIGGQKYTITKLPATVGREIITQYPVANLPKIGSYEASEAIMRKLMSYVYVNLTGKSEPLALTTKELIDSHVKTAVDLMLLEKAMLQYNFDFLADGKILSFLAVVERVAGEKITAMLTNLLAQSSPREEQLYTN